MKKEVKKGGEEGGSKGERRWDEEGERGKPKRLLRYKFESL